MSYTLSLIPNENLKAGSFLLSNAKIHGLPIVYSSEKFTQTTGYTRADVLFKTTSLQVPGSAFETS